MVLDPSHLYFWAPIIRELNLMKCARLKVLQDQGWEHVQLRKQTVIKTIPHVCTEGLLKCSRVRFSRTIGRRVNTTELTEPEIRLKKVNYIPTCT